MGTPPTRELDVLPLARVEAAQEDLLGVPVAALVGEEDAGRELEQLGRVLARHPGELADAQVEVARPARRGCGAPFDQHLGTLVRAGQGGLALRIARLEQRKPTGAPRLANGADGSSPEAGSTRSGGGRGVRSGTGPECGSPPGDHRAAQA